MKEQIADNAKIAKVVHIILQVSAEQIVNARAADFRENPGGADCGRYSATDHCDMCGSCADHTTRTFAEPDDLSVPQNHETIVEVAQIDAVFILGAMEHTVDATRHTSRKSESLRSPHHRRA